MYSVCLWSSNGFELHSTLSTCIRCPFFKGTPLIVCIVNDSSPVIFPQLELYIYDVKYMIILFSLQEYTGINHSTVMCVMSAWTNVLKESTSADRILGTMKAVSA